MSGHSLDTQRWVAATQRPDEIAQRNVLRLRIGDLIGTLEFSGYSFQTGGYTTFAYGTEPGSASTQLFGVRHSSSGGTYFNLGTGLRLVVCNKVDLGVPLAYPLSSPNWTNPEVLAEFRWRF